MRTLFYFLFIFATIPSNANTLEALCKNLDYYRRGSAGCKKQSTTTEKDGSTVITFETCEQGLDHITFAMRNVPSEDDKDLGPHQSCTQTEYRLDLGPNQKPHKDSNGQNIFKTITTIFRKFGENTTVESISKDINEMIVRISSTDGLIFICSYKGEAENCKKTKPNNFSNRPGEIDTPIKSLQVEDWNKLRKGEIFEFRVEQPRNITPVKQNLFK